MRLFKDGKAQKTRAFDFSKSLILARAQYTWAVKGALPEKWQGFYPVDITELMKPSEKTALDSTENVSCCK